jgi:hypothetical protein
MEKYYLFYDLRNVLMAKRNWTEEEFLMHSKSLKDAAACVQVDRLTYGQL